MQHKWLLYPRGHTSGDGGLAGASINRYWTQGGSKGSACAFRTCEGR